MESSAVRCCRVRASIARDIAAEFVTAPSTACSPVVRAAYAQLTAQTDRIFADLTRARRARRYRVVFTALLAPYRSDLEMIAAVRSSRLLEVTTATVDRDRGHPLMDCSRGDAYDRFRAVHDLIGHVGPQLGFDRDEEYTAWLLQDQTHSGLARWALATELHGENSVLWTTGQLAEHKAILLDARLLRDSRGAAYAAAG